jgi:hypothetical protein
VKGCYCFSSNVKHVLRLLALWSCGRRGSVVQAQRQIHRAHLGRPNRERSKASGQRGLNGQRDDISSSGSIVPSARAQPLPVVADAPDRLSNPHLLRYRAGTSCGRPHNSQKMTLRSRRGYNDIEA